MKAHAIFGPPGTGKTRRLVELAANEVAEGSRCLFLSFTKAAAQEAASRVTDKRIVASTLHSFAFKHIGMSRDSVIDDVKKQKFSQIVGVPIRGPEEDEPQIGDNYFEVISYAANRLIPIYDAYDDFGRPGTPREFERFANEYRDWKSTYGYHDFDDMLDRLGSAASVTVPPVIMLDEAQDCSPLQWRAFEKMAAKAQRVYIAGDDDQAIYEWSGADPHGMTNFAAAKSADVIALGKSHRMPESVHTFVHDSILAKFGRRQDKQFAPRKGGKDAGVTRFGSIHEYDIRSLLDHESVLVLVRDRFRSLDVQRALNQDLVPYKIAGGYSPYDNGLARAIRAVIHANMGEMIPGDELNSLAMKLGTTTDEAIGHVMGRDWREVLPMGRQKRDFYEALGNEILKPIRVTLSTIHQAKGREAGHVVVNLELTDRVAEAAFRNPDAELRVMYVACTRAKEGLHLCAENHLI